MLRKELSRPPAIVLTITFDIFSVNSGFWFAEGFCGGGVSVCFGSLCLGNLYKNTNWKTETSVSTHKEFSVHKISLETSPNKHIIKVFKNSKVRAKGRERQFAALPYYIRTFKCILLCSWTYYEAWAAFNFWILPSQSPSECKGLPQQIKGKSSSAKGTK